MKKIVLILLLACHQVANADEDINSGNFWYDVCTSSAKSLCATYVFGVISGIKIQAAGTQTEIPYCLPIGGTNEQYADIFTNYLKTTPESRHYSAASLVVLSLSKSFPCAPHKNKEVDSY